MQARRPPHPAALPAAEVFSDGACRGNPGPGGWGVIVADASGRRELSGGDPRTTNNRMELMGAIEGLRALAAPSRVRLVTDSQYVVRGMTEWIGGWMRRGWRKTDGARVLNQDLWELLLAAAGAHQVTWEWIRGHAGHRENERCDALANQAIDALAPR